MKRLVTKFGDHGRVPALSELNTKRLLEGHHSPIRSSTVLPSEQLEARCVKCNPI